MDKLHRKFLKTKQATNIFALFTVKRLCSKIKMILNYRYNRRFFQVNLQLQSGMLDSQGHCLYLCKLIEKLHRPPSFMTLNNV